MTIAFDARMIEHSGIGTHIRGLLRAARRMRHPPEMTLLGDLNVLTSLKLQRGFQVEHYTAPIYSPWAQLTFPRRWRGAQALHVPHYNIPYRFLDPLVVTVHDLIHLLFPWHAGSAFKVAYARYTFGRLAKRADIVLCVSEHTRHDVIERLGVAEDRTSILPNAVDEDFQPVEDPTAAQKFRRRLGLPQEYLLAVGIDKPHKNLPFLLRSLKPLWQDGKLDAPLAIAGCGGAAHRVQDAIARNKVEQWARLLDWIPYADMPLLYQCASALVFPSTYEGFGLPVLEAQRIGTPVASSDAASLPEVAGDGAVFFDPSDEESCRFAVMSALTDSALRERLVGNGHANERRYSWDESARRLLDVYKLL